MPPDTGPIVGAAEKGQEVTGSPGGTPLAILVEEAHAHNGKQKESEETEERITWFKDGEEV